MKTLWVVPNCGPVRLYVEGLADKEALVAALERVVLTPSLARFHALLRGHVALQLALRELRKTNPSPTPQLFEAGLGQLDGIRQPEDELDA